MPGASRPIARFCRICKSRKVGLPPRCGARILREMFLVNETDAAAIRAIFDEHGELSAAIELRRRFPGIIDNESARACARSIASWTPLPVGAPKVTRRRRNERPGGARQS
jgi:hypothetical protein